MVAPFRVPLRPDYSYRLGDVTLLGTLRHTRWVLLAPGQDFWRRPCRASAQRYWALVVT